MTEEMMARCFDEWFDRYTRNPTAFMAECQAVIEHMKEREAGVEPSYGRDCAAYMRMLEATHSTWNIR